MLKIYIIASVSFVLGLLTCSMFIVCREKITESIRLKKVNNILCAMLSVASRFVWRAEKEDGDTFWRLASRALKLSDPNNLNWKSEKKMEH